MGWFTQEREELYNGIYMGSSDAYHIVFLKNDEQAWQLAQYVFDWYRLLDRKMPVEPPERSPSDRLGFGVGLPGLSWVTGISQEEMSWYIKVVAERGNWWFGAADLLTIPVEQVSRNIPRLKEIAKRNLPRFHRISL